MSDSIASRQEEIVEEFSIIDGDMEMTINYVMELGEQLPKMSAEYRTDDHLVKGCQSKVWLHADQKSTGEIVFEADSNTAITKGLVSLLVRTLNDKMPDEILNAEISFPQQIGMNRFIGTQRSNGFASMIKQIKLYALAFAGKNTTKA